jgi:hypothetical protein
MEDLLYILNIGDELYSPICGKCIVVALDSEEIFCITVKNRFGATFEFDRYGKFALGGECLLFFLN